jgi:hypothetical protein
MFAGLPHMTGFFFVFIGFFSQILREYLQIGYTRPITNPNLLTTLHLVTFPVRKVPSNNLSVEV